MQMGQRVENGCPALLLPSPKGVLGLTTLSQYIYVFFPQKIRVYQQLPSRPNPELVEEIYLSKKNICRFAVSQQYIAVLFEDSALEVRLRQYWEVVQYSSSLNQPSAGIDSLEIDANKVYYRFKKDEENHPTFGFIDLSDKVQQIQYWQQTKPLQKLIHRHKLGSIPDFYVSLIDNQIRFGMYYQEQASVLKQFEFGTISEPDPDNKVISVHLLQSQQIRKENESEKKDLFLVKLVEENIAKKEKDPPKKKNKNKEKANPNWQNTKKLRLKYIKFFEQQIHYPSEEQNITPEDKKFKVFQQMLYSMQQIQANTNCQKSEYFGKFNNDQVPTHHQAFREKQPWKYLDVPISPDQMDSFDIIRKGSILYINTGSQIISFCFKETPCLQLVQQFSKQDDFYKVKDICQHGLILIGQALFAMPFASHKQSKQPDFDDKKKQEIKEGKKKEFIKQKSRESSGSKEQNTEIVVVPPIEKPLVVESQMQTQIPTDVFLDQFEEQQLSEIIDKLFQKKKVFDQETQTQKISISICEVQTEAISEIEHFDQKNEEKEKDKEKEKQKEKYEEKEKEIEKEIEKEKQEKEKQKEKQVQVDKIIKVMKIDQETQIQGEIETKKIEFQQKGVGESLPLCPECHHCSLTAISKSLKKIQDNSGNKLSELARNALKSEQQKIKNDVLAKIKSIVESTVGQKVVPIVEASVKALLDQKLTEINSYIYSLAMNNLMALNQQLEKDVVRQNGIRNDLLRKQMHEINESKKAVAQMVQICKARQIQKIVFFENIEKKFNQIDEKVTGLEEKIRNLTKNEEQKDENLHQEIEYVKSLLLEEMNREDRDIESEREQDQEKESQQYEEEEQESMEEISQEEQSSSQDEGESLAVHHHLHAKEMHSKMYPPPFAAMQQPYWQMQPPPPQPYPYYPQHYPQYQQQYMMPPAYPGYYGNSFQYPVPQVSMPKPPKKLRLPPSEQLETYSIPMEIMRKGTKSMKKIKKSKA